MNDQPHAGDTRCGHCDARAAVDARFCGACGSALRVGCGFCGVSVPFARFCANCGLALRRSLLEPGRPVVVAPPVPPRVEAADDVAQLHDTAVEGALLRATPSDELTDKIRAAGADIVGERRKVVVLFSDVSGFTAMSEKMDPEEVHEIMNECFTGLVEVIYRYEGYIDKFIGDCIMALFGAPLAHEDDVARALFASLEMAEWLAGYSSTLERTTGLGLGMHSGVNYGTVVAGGLGSDLRMDYTVIGDTVNVASRLESAARRGETFVSETVHAVGRRQFEFRDVEPLTLKGKQRPVPAFALIAERTDPEPVRGVDEFELALVGRDAQLAQVRAAAADALAGSGGVVSVTGEPGVGKSRLASEFMRATGMADTRTLRASCLSYTTRAPYYLFQELLRSWAGIEPSDTPDVAGAALDGALGSHDADLAEWKPYLMALLAPGDEAAADTLANLDPQTRQRLTDRAIVEALHAVAESGPVVVACDDLHWIDEASERVLGRLVEATRDVPLLLLAIYRQEFDPKWSSSSWTKLHLEALPGHHTRELVSALLGGVELPEAFVELVGAKSSGNPYFIEEILRSFVDSGALARVDGEWKLAKDVDAADVPDALQAVIMGRLDGTPEECRRIMQTASVVGAEFGSDMLGELGWPLSEAAASLEYLRSLGMLFETQPLPEQRHAFRQEFVRDVCYETLLLSARRDLHGEVADAIERLQGRGASPALLLEHCVKARRWRDAVAHALRSAADARDVYANRAAAAYYEQALELAARAVEDDATPETSGVTIRERLTALEGLGAVRSLMGEYDESMTAYEGMLEQAAILEEVALDEGRLRRGEALRSFASVHVRRGEYDDALGRLRESVTVLEATTTHEGRRELSKALTQIASVHFHHGEYEQTREFSRRSQELADEIGAAPEAAFANLIWGLASYRQGDPADARERFETSLAVRERLGDVNGVAAVLQNLGNLCMDQTDYDGADEYYSRCLEIRRRVGDVAGTANVLNGLGNVCLGRVDYDGAAERFGECLEIFEGIGAGFGIAVATLNLGQIENERRNLDVARDYLERALAAAEPLKARDLIADITASFARVHTHAGAWGEAKHAATQALATAREIANPGIEAKALWALATVALAERENSHALSLFTEGVDAARSADLTLWEARTLLGRAEAAQATGDIAAAHADLAAAEAAFPNPAPERDREHARAVRVGLGG